jgi:hypothetical protein
MTLSSFKYTYVFSYLIQDNTIYQTFSSQIKGSTYSEYRTVFQYQNQDSEFFLTDSNFREKFSNFIRGAGRYVPELVLPVLYLDHQGWLQPPFVNTSHFIPHYSNNNIRDIRF